MKDMDATKDEHSESIINRTSLMSPTMCSRREKSPNGIIDIGSVVLSALTDFLYKSFQKWYNRLNFREGVGPMDLTDKQWEVIQAFVPEHVSRPDGRGRPRADDR